MDADLARNWWWLALRGVAGILFGIGAFVWPGITLAALVGVFVAYTLLDGIFTLVVGLRMRQQQNSWWMILEGLTGIGLGVLTFVWPSVTTLVVLSCIAGWSILTGVLQIASALRLRKVIANEWLLILSGIVSLVFGVLLIVFPSAGAVSIVWWIGSYALIFGVLTLVVSFRLRGMRDTFEHHTARPA